MGPRLQRDATGYKANSLGCVSNLAWPLTTLRGLIVGEPIPSCAVVSTRKLDYTERSQRASLLTITFLDRERLLRHLGFCIKHWHWRDLANPSWFPLGYSWHHYLLTDVKRSQSVFLENMLTVLEHMYASRPDASFRCFLYPSLTYIDCHSFRFQFR